MNHLSKKVLGEKLWQTGFLPQKWMLTYLRKDEVIILLKFVKKIPEGKSLKIPESEVAKLRARQQSHLEKNKLAKKRREERYGTSSLTANEILKSLVNSHPTLYYKGKRVFTEPFESVTGSARGKVASVFSDDEGKEFLLTKTESKFLYEECGVSMPKEAWTLKKNARAGETHQTLGDFFA